MSNDFDLIHSIGRKFSENPDDELVLGADTLGKVTTPTHFIWGLDDTFGGRDVGEWTVEQMPDATVEFIADSGHLPWLDDPAPSPRPPPPSSATTAEEQRAGVPGCRRSR
ncbi:MAG: alpha/beta hydrolase [Acidimicrobiia bacterium]|nr:alpha/beta hydrolase [Acidimicrobiia bacterium]